MTSIRATPFHGRAAASNAMNLWQPRAGWTLAECYGDANEEALAARLTCAMADITWRSRVVIEGARAQEFLARLVTRDPAALEPGVSFKALWLSDRGGVRGAGVLARHGRETFQLVSAASDLDWIARGAALFDVRVREVLEEEGDTRGRRALCREGPRSGRARSGAGAARHCASCSGADSTSRCRASASMAATRSRCKADDAPLVWDRIAKAGRGLCAQARRARRRWTSSISKPACRGPVRDYTPASGGFDAAPTPFELGLESLIDDEPHALQRPRRLPCRAAHQDARRHRVRRRRADAACTADALRLRGRTHAAFALFAGAPSRHRARRGGHRRRRAGHRVDVWQCERAGGDVAVSALFEILPRFAGEVDVARSATDGGGGAAPSTASRSPSPAKRGRMKRRRKPDIRPLNLRQPSPRPIARVRAP